MDKHMKIRFEIVTSSLSLFLLCNYVKCLKMLKPTRMYLTILNIQNKPNLYLFKMSNKLSITTRA